MALIASEPCTLTKVRRPRVTGLQLHRGQAVLDRAAPRAAIAFQVHAQQPKVPHLRGDLPREHRLLIPLADVRDDPTLNASTAWRPPSPLPQVANPEAVAKQAAATSATGRFTQPQEVADLVLLLASDRAANVTGADFVIDGGLVTTL